MFLFCILIQNDHKGVRVCYNVNKANEQNALRTFNLVKEFVCLFVC